MISSSRVNVPSNGTDHIQIDFRATTIVTSHLEAA